MHIQNKCSELFEKKCISPSVSKYKVEDSLYKCECGRDFDNPQSINGHFGHCLIHRKGNPPTNRFESGYGWNKGLTKENDIRIKNTADSFKKNLNSGKTIHSFKGKKHSNETKNHLSISRMKYLEKNPHIKWYSISNGIKEIKVQGIWELNVAGWLNKNNISWDRKTIRYGNRRYTPDFYLIDSDEYLEVKGWLKDRDLRKMFSVLNTHPNIRVKIMEKTLYKKIEFLDLKKIPLFNEKYSIDDIDFDKFNDIWN